MKYNDLSLMVLLASVLFLFLVIFTVKSSKEYGSNIIHPQRLGLGAYPPNLYGEPTRNRYYSDDLKAAMRYGDAYSKMSGLKFGSFDVNQALGYGRHQQEEKVDYI